jgi:DNA-binding transcriptional ArsR family regulator
MTTPATVSPLDAIAAARGYTRNLPEHLRLLWLTLATYYPHIFPDADTLARNIGKSRRTTMRYLRELEQLGAITTERRYVREDGETRARAYRTLILPELGTSPPDELPDWTVRAGLGV